jgi:small-conductance mechanosensitive channel
VIQDFTGLSPALQRRIALTVAALVGLYLLRRLVLRLASPRLEDPKSRYKLGKSTAYVTYVLGAIILLEIWLETVGNLGTFLGLLTAGLAIALKDLVSNLAGWGFILLRQPFEVGDRIQIGEHRGDVVDIRIFQFTLLEIGNWVHADQSTGRIIHVPNAQVFSIPLANDTAEFDYVWHELPVLVTFESDWRKAKEILQAILDEQGRDVAAEAAQTLRRGSRRFLISYRKFSPKVYTSVEDSGVLLTLRFLAPVRARRGFTESLWEAILDAFHQEDGIDLAYPTQRMYLNPVEGKRAARAPWPGMEPPPPRAGAEIDGGEPGGTAGDPA